MAFLSQFNEAIFIHSLEGSFDNEKIQNINPKDSIGFLATEDNILNKDLIKLINIFLEQNLETRFKAFYFNNEQKKLISEKFNKYQYKIEDYGIKVEHITQTLKRYEKKLRKVADNKPITYHHPCHLGRLSGVYEEPREILKDLGYDVKELSNNREKSMCCGGGGGLINNNPDLSKKIAENVLQEVDKNYSMISPCHMCYYQFKQNTKDINVQELSEIILNK